VHLFAPLGLTERIELIRFLRTKNRTGTEFLDFDSFVSVLNYFGSVLDFLLNLPSPSHRRRRLLKPLEHGERERVCGFAPLRRRKAVMVGLVVMDALIGL